MNCPKCSLPIADSATFCHHCGSAVAAAPAYQQPAAPNYQQPYGQPTGYGQPYGQPTGYGQPYGRPYSRPARPAKSPRRTLEGVSMKFYQMLVDWLMYVLGGLCIFIGVFYICRWNFAPGIKELLYEYADTFELMGVNVMNILFGILMILVGGAWVGLRFLLDRYHKDSPKFTCLMFLVTGGVVFLYRIIAWSILASRLNEGMGDMAVYSAYDGIMVGLLFFLLCGVAFYEVGRYFGKRTALFR